MDRGPGEAGAGVGVTSRMNVHDIQYSEAWSDCDRNSGQCYLGSNIVASLLVCSLGTICTIDRFS